jgi:diguanylate cyclase (GGDEF)-like protein
LARVRDQWVYLCTGQAGGAPLDEEQYRRRILVLTGLFWLLTVIGLTFIVPLFLQMSPEGQRAANGLLLTTGVSVLLSMLVLRFLGNRILALHLLLLLFTGAFAWACTFFGGTRSPTYALLILVPALAAIAGSIRASSFWGLLVLLIWVSLLVMERLGMQFEQIIRPQNYNISITLSYCAMGVAMVSVISLYAEMNKQLRRSLQRSNAELAHLSTHDDLTALHNRRHFDERLSAALQRAREQEECLGLLLFDLNDFKEINDSYGHGTGDLMLATLGERVRATLRSTDLAARLGGDEFAVVVENVTSLEQVTSIADKLAAAISEPVEVRHKALRFSASFGIALYPSHATEPETLVELADRAMYRAKSGGSIVATANA